MTKLLRRACLAACFLLVSSVFAEENSSEGGPFSKGKLLLSIGGGIGKPRSPAIDLVAGDPTALLLQQSRLLRSTDPTDQMLGFVTLTQPKPEASSTSVSVDILYQTANWFTIGASISSTTIKVKNAPALAPNLFIEMFFGLGTTPSAVATRRLFDVMSLSKGTVTFERLNTAEWAFGFHFGPVFGSNVVDPYLNFGIGGGSVTGGTVAKYSAKLGCRVAVAGSLFVYVEGYGDAFTILSTDSGSGGGGATTVNDAGGRFGVGIAL